MSGTTIHILCASGRLKPYEKKLRKGIRRHVSLLKKYIPFGDVDIIVSDSPEATIPHLGVGGFTPNAHTIYISLDPTFKAFKKTLEQYLHRTISHEIHHVARWAAVGYGTSLFEALVSEGLADHFDIEIAGQDPQEWDTIFTEREVSYFLKKAQKEFDNTSYNHRDWFFGSEKRGIPKWTGYAL